MPLARLAAALTAAALLVAGSPALAGPVGSDAGDALPSFVESRGCGPNVAGPQRPLVDSPGSLPAGTELRGPFADFFGRNQSQIEGSLVRWAIPGGGGRTAMVHERVLPALRQVADTLAAEAAAGRTYAVTDAIAYSFRTVAGGRNLSNHAFGNAIDINPRHNPYRGDNVLITDMPDWYVAAWEAAGFCWGGDWVYIKDTMHYSWMGPRFTPGYGTVPPPYPPLTAASPFSRPGATASHPFDPAASRLIAVADRSGDGAEDLYAVTDHAGGLRVQAAGARAAFEVIGYRADVAAGAPPEAQVLLGDWDADAAADVWVATSTPGATTLTIHTDAAKFAPAATFSVPTPLDATTQLGVADANRDSFADLFVLRQGDPVTVEVWNGADGFATALLAGPTSLTGVGNPANWQLAIADHDVDGRPDLLAVERTAAARVRIVRQRDGAYAAPLMELATAVDATGGRTVAVGDYDGDGRDDLYLVGDRTLTVYLGGERDPRADLTSWFMPDEPAPWDAGPECIGPARCHQIGVTGPDGLWRIKDAVSSEALDVEFGYGNPGDVPFLGDWDCDGIDTPGLYRRRDGFVYLRNSNSTGIANVQFFFGNPDDLPLAGDFDGDGCDSVSLYRPGEATVYVINRLGDGQGGLGAADYSFMFGNVGDKPFSGDFDGDGIDEVGLHRETTGLVYYRNTLSAGIADHSFIFGDPGDRLVAGDWNGDGTDTMAVYRPGDGNWYIKLTNGPGVADHVVHYHRNVTHGAAQPVVGATATSSGG